MGRYKVVFVCFSLSILALLAGLPFLFTGAELYGGKRQSDFWSNNIQNDRFSKKRGIIYLDRLDRGIEYRMDLTFEVTGGLKFDSPAVDREKIPFMEEQRELSPSGGKERTELKVSFEIPKSEEKGAVIRLDFVKASVAARNANAKNIQIRSARIEPLDTQYEMRHLFRIFLVSLATGFAVFFTIRKLSKDGWTALFFAAPIILAVVFLLSSFSFRYIFAVFERSIMIFFFFAAIIGCLAAGILRIGKNGNRESGSEKAAIKDKIAVLNIRTEDKRFDRFAWFALFILSLSVFSYNFGNDFISDDFFLLRNYSANELLGTFTGPSDPFGCCPQYYRPLSVVFFQVQHALFGKCYPLYYLLRFLHIYLNCMLLYALLKKLGLRPLSALAGAAVMAVSVYSSIAAGWLSSAYDVLMITFLLLAMYFKMGERTARGNILSLLFFIAALMTKEPAVMLPFFLIGMDIISGRKLEKKDYIFHLACVILLILYFAFRFLIFGGLAGMEQKHSFFSLSNIPGITGRIFKVLYLLFIFPGGSLYQYSKGIGVSTLSWSLLFVIFAAAAAVSFRKIKIKEYSIHMRALLTGFLWILMFLLPIIFPFDFYRLAYILVPGVSIVIASAAGILRSSSLSRWLKTAAVILFVLALANQSVRNLQVGYNRLGKGSLSRFTVNVGELKTWDKNLPPEIKKEWKKKLYERK